MDRPDACDFNSTKFNCNWASLIDAEGHGWCLTFPPTQREDVRGGIEPNGSCTLVVNRCFSPPRDISTKIVPDYYTVIKANQQVTGNFPIKGAAAQ